MPAEFGQAIENGCWESISNEIDMRHFVHDFLCSCAWTVSQCWNSLLSQWQGRMQTKRMKDNISFIRYLLLYSGQHLQASSVFLNIYNHSRYLDMLCMHERQMCKLDSDLLDIWCPNYRASIQQKVRRASSYNSFSLICCILSSPCSSSLAVISW